MSHHGNQPNHALSEAMRPLLGEYPEGRLNSDDAGALAIAVTVENGKVVLAFPKPVAWIGFNGDQAMALAQLLMKHAKQAGLTKPFTLVI